MFALTGVFLKLKKNCPKKSNQILSVFQLTAARRSDVRPSGAAEGGVQALTLVKPPALHHQRLRRR